MKRLILLSTLVLGLVSIFSAAAAETPEEFSTRYFESMRRNGMRDMVNFIHPDELKKLADFITEIADAEARDGKTESVPFLKNGETLESLRKLPSAEIANKFLVWVGEVAPQLTQMLRTAEVKTVGHVTDGDTVYVVAKLSFTMDGEVINATDVLQLRRDGENFKMLLKAEMTGILKAMKKATVAKAKK